MVKAGAPVDETRSWEGLVEHGAAVMTLAHVDAIIAPVDFVDQMDARNIERNCRIQALGTTAADPSSGSPRPRARDRSRTDQDAHGRRLPMRGNVGLQ